MSKVVFCSVPDDAHAETVIARLQAAGFSNNQVSALFPERGKVKNLVLEKHSKAPEGAAAGGGTGGVIGGVLGWLVGIGSLAIPGIGPFIAAGPILAALSGAAVGAAAGGLIGSLVGLGVTELEAKKYETKLKEGEILISVHAQSGDEVEKARKIFADAGASDITETKEIAA
ncbi:MAG TPA: hypothetical protein VJR29_14255 [bacterium]|nr:hypothetical protein [bacterium]